MSTRRGFLGAILAASVAPAFIRNAMPLKAVGEAGILAPEWIGPDEAMDSMFEIVEDLARVDSHPLFRGEPGRYDCVKNVESPLIRQAAINAWSAALFAEAARPSSLGRLLSAENKNAPLIINQGWLERK